MSINKSIKNTRVNVKVNSLKQKEQLINLTNEVKERFEAFIYDVKYLDRKVKSLLSYQDTSFTNPTSLFTEINYLVVNNKEFDLEKDVFISYLENIYYIKSDLELDSLFNNSKYLTKSYLERYYLSIDNKDFSLVEENLTHIDILNYVFSEFNKFTDVNKLRKFFNTKYDFIKLLNQNKSFYTKTLLLCTESDNDIKASISLFYAGYIVYIVSIDVKDSINRFKDTELKKSDIGSLEEELTLLVLQFLKICFYENVKAVFIDFVENKINKDIIKVLKSFNFNVLLKEKIYLKVNI